MSNSAHIGYGDPKPVFFAAFYRGGKFAVVFLFAIALVFASPVFSKKTANAAELLVLEQRGCYMCKRFKREIASAYPRTRQGRIAPLRHIDIFDPWPKDLKKVRSDVFTPTFVLVENGREVARLRGYPGPDYFWYMIDEMLVKLPRRSKRRIN